MRPLLSTAIILAAGAALAGAASAQPMGDPGAAMSSPPIPDTAREARGIPGPEAVNPAPGAAGAYVGAGRRGFYDVDARIAAVSDRARSLPPGQQRRAMVQLHQIRAEEATQRARHGDLRDWDRENLNDRLDHLVQQFPSLAAGGEGAFPPTR